MIRLRRRSQPDPRWFTTVYGIAALVGLVFSVGLIFASGAPVAASLSALLQGAAGSPAALASSVVKAVPMVLTGLATCLVYRAGLWTVAQEAQVLLGAAAAWQMSLWAVGLPPLAVLGLCFLAGMAGGAVLGAVIAWMRSRYAVNEIVSSMMFNYVVFFALSWLIAGPWKASGGTASYQQTTRLEQALWLPNFFDPGKLHIGVLAMLLVMSWLLVMLSRTPLGYEIRGMGLNATALAQKGVNMPRLVLSVMVLSGAVAGMVGMVEVFGVTHRITGTNLVGLGFDGIIVALVGRLNPIGTLAAGLFFGALHNGALFMNVMTGVPTALATAIEGVVLILFLIAGSLAGRHVEWSR